MTEPRESIASIDPLTQAIDRLGSADASQRAAHNQPLDQTVKTLAKNLAQQMTEDVADRKLRATVRTRCYNALVPLLRRVGENQVDLRARGRRMTLVAMTSGLLWLLGLSGWWLAG